MAKVVGQRHAPHPVLVEDVSARCIRACGGSGKKERPQPRPSNGLHGWLKDLATASHRFSRVAIGWTESAKSKGENCEVGERDDVDGLSKEELEALATNQSDTGEPVSAQAEANDQAEAWAVQWGVKERKT